MTKAELKDLAELIVLRLNQGLDLQAMKLWEIALQQGADFDKLEAQIYKLRYKEA